MSNLAPVLYLAKGARVMCTWNGWKVAGLVNGAQGIVHEILYAEGQGPPSMPIAVLEQFRTNDNLTIRHARLDTLGLG